MRSLVAVTVICLISTPAFACVVDSECEFGTICLEGVCTRAQNSDNGEDNTPVKQPTNKTCYDDNDCTPGSRCIKGSGIDGVCIGH